MRMVAPYTGAWIEMFTADKDIAVFPSLPTRERGLKSNEKVVLEVDGVSLPTRERGLKSLDGVTTDKQLLSLPARERGFK